VTTLSLTAGVTPRDRVEQVGLFALIGMVAAAQLSIAIAEILLSVAILCWFITHLSRRERLEAPAFFWPLIGYAMLTLLSAGFSQNPVISVTDCKQITLFFLIPVVYDFARRARARNFLTVVITIGAVSALVGIVQFAVLNYDILGRRPQGTLSHWMTYSGTLMLVICTTVARLLYDNRDRGWAAVVMPALVVSLVLTSTRSAWVGVTAGVGVLFLLRDFRLMALLPIAAAVFIALSPAQFTDRMYSIFDLNDPTSRDRVAMLEAGVAIVKDHPLTGVGPDMIVHVYPDYRVANAVQESNIHLHNVPMQIAAERGLPALVLWLWFIGSALVGLRPLLDRARQRVLASTAVAATIAMLTAGLFEYNFGDSEFLMLYLILLTLPFAADREAPRVLVLEP
jgi:O-antigen ligase